ALPELVPRLLERHRVRPGVAGPEPRKRAEQAARDAHVRRFEADVEVVVGARAVALLALAVGEPAERERVGAVEQADAVLERQALAGVEFPGNIVKSGGPDPLPSCLHSRFLQPSSIIPLL